MALEKQESNNLPSEVGIAGFRKEALKGKWDEKRRNPRSTIQSSVFLVFEQKTVKGTGDEKSKEK